MRCEVGGMPEHTLICSLPATLGMPYTKGLYSSMKCACDLVYHWR